MRKFKYLFLSLALSCFSTSCAKKGSEAWDFAIAPGTYLLTGPSCISTGAAPVYKNIDHRINLFDFDGIQKHSIKIEGPASIRTISDGSCTVQITQPIHTNKNGSFANQLSRQLTFEPESCTLTISIGNDIYSAGRLSSEGLQNRDSPNMDLPFIINTTDSGFDMTSADVPALNELWREYGCANPDRIKWNGVPE